MSDELAPLSFKPMPPHNVRRLLAQATHVLFDFDGPVCALFADLTAGRISEQLRAHLAEHGVSIPAELAASRDPFDALDHAAAISPELAASTEARLRTLEIDAARSAEPTPQAAEAIRALHAAGRTLAIVTNNAPDAARTYLHQHHLTSAFAVIIGRTSADPQLLKPHPHLINQALAALGKPASAACLMIGDSSSDITAAHHAGVPAIGYANKPGRSERLADAEAVITDMRALADVDQLPN